MYNVYKNTTNDVFGKGMIIMKLDGLLRRANLNSLETFLLNGGESFKDPSVDTYSERLKKANKKLSDFLSSVCDKTDIEEYDKTAGEIYEQIAVHEDVYFEMGLILGAKIAFQARGKMEELK